jgi:hypothetical protein
VEELKPFDKLDEQQQKCCVDIAIGVSVIASRVPTFGRDLFRAIANEWANCAELDENLCRYALSGVTTELYNSTWEFHLTKENGSMVCQFIKRNEPGGGNGEYPVASG